jgi:hypothetical protein
MCAMVRHATVLPRCCRSAVVYHQHLYRTGPPETQAPQCIGICRLAQLTCCSCSAACDSAPLLLPQRRDCAIAEPCITCALCLLLDPAAGDGDLDAALELAPAHSQSAGEVAPLGEPGCCCLPLGLLLLLPSLLLAPMATSCSSVSSSTCCTVA